MDSLLVKAALSNFAQLCAKYNAQLRTGYWRDGEQEEVEQAGLAVVSAVKDYYMTEVTAGEAGRE